MRGLAFATIICCAAWPSAASFLGAGVTDGLRREPVPAIVDQVTGADTDVFPDVRTRQTIVLDDVPLPPRRVDLTTPEVSIGEICDALTAAAQSHRLPVPFFIRLIWQESRFDPRAISPVGAQGMAQFMPATAAAMGLGNPFDPLQALQFSARLLRELLGQFGNLGLAAAAYNAGPKRIDDWLARRGELPAETRNYVESITGHAAERWRVTRPGRLALDVPKRAPCRSSSALAYAVEVPAPVPKRPAQARLAKGKAKHHKPAAVARKKAPVEISAARKRGKARIAEKAKKPPIERSTSGG
ncbi:MAG: transglycosylase SLT domain-containing protein [Rhizobiales bacterium]|nr:transglycosylase SLT domain-containing protein [Hyphomicrobiales bacterium]